MQAVVRRARSGDQPAITAMVRQARLNPTGLHWDQFVVGERDSRAVGVAQVRRHSDGTKELASLVVEAGAREQGIATQMVDALLADETAAVYALIDRRFVGHFARWGFRQVDPSELPRALSRTYLIGRAVTTLGSLLRRQRIRIVPLRRPVADGPGGEGRPRRHQPPAMLSIAGPHTGSYGIRVTGAPPGRAHDLAHLLTAGDPSRRCATRPCGIRTGSRGRSSPRAERHCANG